MTLLLERGVEGTCNRVMEDMGECVLYWLGMVAEKETIVV